ncbi:YrhB domain-containing protein [Streptomyces sp. NPDC046900]|uniref:YrhB domain-containing protein n=1 Tax=Streptomyces sp. NPDC046900 TaxID=3155473 RepID=UPI0034014B13
MIEREFAMRLVEAQLERKYRRELAVYGDSVRVAVTDASEHPLGWMISWQSEEYLRTQDSRHALAGNGPYFVDKEDGSLHEIPVVDAVTGAWESDYRSRVKGQQLPEPVDALHAEVRSITETHGKVHALRLLRRQVPAFSIRDATTCTAALQAGLDPPADLIAAARDALPRPTQPAAFGVQTITGPNPPMTASFPAPVLTDYAAHRRRQTAQRCVHRFVGDFRELRTDAPDNPSIHEAAGLEPRAHETEVATYLRSGSVLAATGTMGHDMLRDDGTAFCMLTLQTDGTWFWYSGLAYYVETYPSPSTSAFSPTPPHPTGSLGN